MTAQASVVRWLCGLGLAVLLALGIRGLVRQAETMAGPMPPLAQLWLDPDAQSRAMLGDVPYDLLQTANALLPPDATVLLVTNGHAVRQTEYITFHRALYYLAPRSVWWLSPAPPDGTWEARWWISAPVDAPSLAAVAASKGATHVLAVGIDDPHLPGQRLFQNGDGFLLALGKDQPVPAVAPTAGMPRLTAPMLVVRLLRLLLGLGSILLWGWLVLVAAGALGHRTRGVEVWALAWALGAGVVGLGMAALNALGLRLSGQIVLLTVGGAVFGALHLVRRTRRGPPALPLVTQPGRALPGTQQSRDHRALRSTLQVVLLGLLLLQLLVVVLPAVGQPLRIWDSWVTWGMKARVIFLQDGIAPAVFADPARAVTLPGYPLLFPLVEAWLYGWMGAVDDRLVGIVSVLWYLSLGGIVYGALRRLPTPRLTATAVTAALLLMPGISSWVGTVMADIPLAVYVTISAVYLVRWLDGEQSGALAISALAAACLVWTKREGMTFLVCLLAVTLLLRWRSRRAWWGVLVLGIAGLVVAVPWGWWVSRHAAPVGDYLPVTWVALRSGLDRVGSIVRALIGSLAGANWSYVWPLLVLAGLGSILLRRPRHVSGTNTPHIWLLTVLSYLAAMAGSYMWSAYAPLVAHLANSIDRVVLPVVPLAGLWLAWWAQGYVRSSNTISGTAEPPPALTLSSEEVLSRTPPPSMSAPPQT